ncbi:MAG: hypothetical protein ABW252_08500 [Polyangiales bacterium]
MRQFLILMSLATGLVACADSADSSEHSDALKQEVAKTPLIEKAGAACAVDADCKGTGTRCLTTSQISGLTYPGGYCTVGCTADADCGEGGACPLAAVDASVFPSAEVQKAVTVCLPKCAADADCREGYVCSTESSLSFIPDTDNAQGYCQPKPAAAPAK